MLPWQHFMFWTKCTCILEYQDFNPTLVVRNNTSMGEPDNKPKKIETAICQNCVTFVDEKPKVYVPPERLPSLDDNSHSTYRRDYPGHKRISPPLVRRPQDALPIATEYRNTYVTTCQERFKPWDMKTIPRYENKAPRRQYTAPEVCIFSSNLALVLGILTKHAFTKLCIPSLCNY